MIRQHDAAVTFVRWANSMLGRAFVWDETCCVALVLQAIDAQSGSDLMGKYRRHMASERCALAWVAKNGLEGIVKRLTDDGCQVIDPAYIRAGDVGLIKLPGTVGAAVWLGRRWLSSDVDGVRQFSSDELATPAIVLGVR